MPTLPLSENALGALLAAASCGGSSDQVKVETNPKRVGDSIEEFGRCLESACIGALLGRLSAYPSWHRHAKYLAEHASTRGF